MPNTDKNALKRLAPAIENAAAVLSEQNDAQLVSQSVTSPQLVSQSVTSPQIVSQSADGAAPPRLAKVVSQSIDSPTL